MDLKFSVSGRIAKPLPEVFEAVVDPQKLSNYFTTGGAKGRLEAGTTVSWNFHDFPGPVPVEVVEVEPDKRIVLRWAASDVSPAGKLSAGSYQTTVTMSFEPLEDGRTLVTISEAGWHDTPSGLKASYGNCEGWTGMLIALKLWVERGMKLREDFYK
jgi:uncharacterized protein YndB with AHSA1/START domain